MSKYPFEDYFLINNKIWLDNLESNINQIGKKLCLSELIINTEARFGVVIFCKYNQKNAVLKLVDMSSQKGQFELYAINNLKYSFMNRVKTYSIDDGYYLSDRLIKLDMPKETNIIGRFNIIKPIFLKVAKEWRNNIEGKDTYWQKFINKINNINRYEISNEMFNHINYACSLYQKNFSHEECRLSHGDLHEKNIMIKRNKLCAIDPLGGFAPFEFEFVKYIENQLFILSLDMVEISLEILLNQLELLGVDSKKLLYALYIDSVERTITSYLLKDPDVIIKKGLERINLIRGKMKC